MALTHPLQLRLFQVAMAGTAVVIGLLAGLHPALAVGAAIGLLFAALVFADLTIGLCLFVLIAFIEALPVIGPLSPPKVIGMLLVLSWLGSLALNRDRRREETLSPLLVVCIIMLPLWAATSTLWSLESGVALESAQRWALNLVLFPIAWTAVRQTKDVELIFVAFLAGTLLTVVLGMLGIFGSGDAVGQEEGRLGGAGINANQLGGLLVSATLFAGALATLRERSAAIRAFWAIIAILSAIALAATLSRGALLGLAVALAFTPLLAGRRRRVPATMAALVAVAAIGLAIAALIPDTAVKRLSSSDRTGSGRTDIWRVGWRMVEDRPIVGVGAGNFEFTTIKYLVQPGVIEQDEFIVDTPKVAHNVYLQVLAELGIVGLALMLVILGICMRAILRAAANFAESGDRAGEMLSRALAIALVGLIAAYFFSSNVYSKQLWLMLALAPPLLAVSISSSRDATGR